MEEARILRVLVQQYQSLLSAERRRVAAHVDTLRSIVDRYPGTKSAELAARGLSDAGLR